jgi:hypothetical protein
VTGCHKAVASSQHAPPGSPPAPSGARSATATARRCPRRPSAPRAAAGVGSCSSRTQAKSGQTGRLPLAGVGRTDSTQEGGRGDDLSACPPVCSRRACDCFCSPPGGQYARARRDLHAMAAWSHFGPLRRDAATEMWPEQSRAPLGSGRQALHAQTRAATPRCSTRSRRSWIDPEGGPACEARAPPGDAGQVEATRNTSEATASRRNATGGAMSQ